MIFRVPLLLLSLALLPLPSQAADLYGGNIRSVTKGEKADNPFGFQRVGNQLRGKIFFNAFSKRLTVKTSVRPSGKFHLRVSDKGVSGLISGRLTESRIRGTGTLQADKSGVAQVTLRGKKELTKPHSFDSSVLVGKFQLSRRWADDGDYPYQSIQLFLEAPVHDRTGFVSPYLLTCVRYLGSGSDDRVAANFPVPKSPYDIFVKNDFTRRGPDITFHYTIRVSRTSDPTVALLTTHLLGRNIFGKDAFSADYGIWLRD